MTAIVVILFAFLVAMGIGEIVLVRQKVQFAAASLALVHGVIFMMTTICATALGEVAPVSVLLFWAGAFLLWLGIRSHIESSILLRMLYLVKESNNSMARSALVHLYDQHHGADPRLLELEKSGFIARRSGRVEILAKGRLARKMYNLITLFWRG